MMTLVRLKLDAPDWRTMGYYNDDKRGTLKMSFIKAKKAVIASFETVGRSYTETIDGDYLVITSEGV